jgi:OmpA-OmpF porin, OOP family
MVPHERNRRSILLHQNKLTFPTNFIMEFDLIPDDKYEHGLQLSFYADTENKELTDDLYPGEKGIHHVNDF